MPLIPALMLKSIMQQAHIPYSVSVGDFNNDGKLDLAVANYDSNTVSVLLNDSNPAATLTIADTPSNTAPTVVAGTTTAFTEQTPVAVTNTITVNDPDGDADWNGGTLQVQITANATADDSLTLPTANNGGIWLNTTGNVLMADTTAIGTANAASVNNGAAWTLTFNAAATNALVQDTARAIQFTNNSDTPSTTARTVTFTATDKNAGTHSDTQTVSVTAVNDAPTGIVTLKGATIVGQTLTASHTLADLDGLGAVNYQWQASTDGSNWSAINGATANTSAVNASASRRIYSCACQLYRWRRYAGKPGQCRRQ